METERLDLSPLDLAADELGHERLVRRVMQAAGPELARRARSVTPLAMVAGWARPTLAAAAVVAILAGGALLTTERSSPAATSSMATALGVPDHAAEWLEDGRGPSEADLVLAMERRQ